VIGDTVLLFAVCLCPLAKGTDGSRILLYGDLLRLIWPSRITWA